jgi:MipA family protein
MLASKRLASVIAFLGLGIGCAQAADLLDGSAPSYKDEPGNYWVVTLGGYAVAEPAFLGSKEFTASGRPIIDVHAAGAREWLTLPNDAFSLTLYQTGDFRVGAAGDWLNNRSHNDDPSALRGLHDIDYTLEAGAFAEYYPVPFLRTRVELLQGITGADGFAANLMADYIYSPDPRWLFTVGPRLQIADEQFQSTFFSVNPAESVVSGLERYHAGGGINSAGVDGTVRYNLTESFSIRAFAEWDRLLGDAADSPIVKERGSVDQVQVGLGGAYRFNFAW